VTYIGNEYGVLVGKSEVKRQLGKPRHRWEDNINAYLIGIGWDVINCIHMIEDRNQR
jgi:hypothetical protein